MTAGRSSTHVLRIAVLGSHPDSGPSMLRYTQELDQAYRSLGYEVRLLRPTNALSRRSPARVVKWLRYLEKLILFPIVIAVHTRGVDVVHVADHSDAPYLGWTWPGRRRLITCHDLFAINAARNLYPGVRTRWTGKLYQAYIARSLHRPDMVIAVSQQTADDVRRLLGERIPVRVVANPLSPSMLDTAPPEGLPPPRRHVLIVSGASWRKRRELAISAWCRLRAVANVLPLVVVGPPLTAVERSVLAEFHLDEAEVTQRSGISDAELVQLYRTAAFLIQFSQYEGYCWPILEANAQGTLALCADEPQLRAVGPDNVFVDARDVPRMSAGVLQHLLDPTIRQRASAHARAFTPERFAESLESILRSDGEGAVDPGSGRPPSPVT